MRNSQPMIASKLELSPCAVSVLGQLFVEGPTSDDNITSKAGRCDLVSAGLAFHEAGLSSLTPDGARLAREWDLCSLYARRDRRWYFKVRTNPRPEGAAVSRIRRRRPVGSICAGGVSSTASVRRAGVLASIAETSPFCRREPTHYGRKLNSSAEFNSVRIRNQVSGPRTPAGAAPYATSQSPNQSPTIAASVRFSQLAKPPLIAGPRSVPLSVR